MGWTGRLSLASVGLALLLAALPGASEEVLTGMCVGVLEADLIEVWVGSATEALRVRLAGVDGASLRSTYGAYAKEHTRELVYGKAVRVEVLERREDGVILGRVLVDGQDVSYRIVAQGLARKDSRAHPDLRLDQAEDAARGERRGLWRRPPPRPTPTPVRARSDLSLSDIAWQVDLKRARNPWPTPTPGPQQGVTIEMTIESWVGSSEAELVTNWGLPTRSMEDGRGGKVFVYERLLDPETDVDLDTRMWRSQGRYDRELGIWVYTEVFFIDPGGTIYDHRWDQP